MSNNRKRRFVLDTSLFTNPNARKRFGKTTLEAVKNFLKVAEGCHSLEFYMPLSIKRELIHFLNDEEYPFLESVITIKSPALYELHIPAAVVMMFIDEIRNRINKGLKISEKVIREDDSEISERIHHLREKYREVLRGGVVDSKEDFAVLMLAKEIDGIICSADTGLFKMADWLGISFFQAERFYELLIYEKNQSELLIYEKNQSE